MVNINDFNATIEKEKTMHPESPYFERDIWLPRLAALGENEDDIIEFMDNADKKTLNVLWSVYEELMDKFPSEKMDKAIDRFLENYQREFNVKFNNC